MGETKKYMIQLGFVVGKIKKNQHIIAIVLLLILLFISHTLYVLNTKQYPEQDEHAYLDMAIRFNEIIHNFSNGGIEKLLSINRYRQTLYGYILGVPLLFLGTTYTYKIALVLNYFFYAGSIVLLYKLLRVYLGSTASVIGAVMFAFYGFPLFYLHFTYSETALTTFMLLTLYFLAKSQFTNRKYTFYMSVAFTLANLTRWVTLFFTLGSFLFVFLMLGLRSFRKKRKLLKDVRSNIFIFILFGILPSLIFYYIPNWEYFRAYILGNTDNAPQWITQFFSAEHQGLQNQFSIRSIMFYLNIMSQQTIFFWALFVVGFFMALLDIKKYGFFLFNIILAYLVFTFGSVLKFDRYIVPIYPMMAAISAITVDKIHNKFFRNVLVGMILLIGVFNFLGSSWAIGPMGQQGLKDIVTPSFVPHPRRIYLTPMVWPPRKEELNAHLLINFFENDWNYAERYPNILSTFLYHPFDNATFSIVYYHKRYLLNAANVNLRSLPVDDYMSAFSIIEKSDYIVVKDKDPVEKYVKDTPDVRMIQNFATVFNSQNGIPSAYKLVQTIYIPLDQSNIHVYKKVRPMNRVDWEILASNLVIQDATHKEKIFKDLNKFILIAHYAL